MKTETIVNWREKINAAYAANTVRELAAKETDRIAQNNAAGCRQPEPISTPLTKQEMAFLAAEEAQIDEANESKIKAIVKDRHCSRREAWEIVTR